MKDENVLEQFTDKELQTFMALREKRTKERYLGFNDKFTMILRLEDESGVVRESKHEETGPGNACASNVIQNINKFLSED
ncbi:hypothetical protein [Methanobacterium paludis]|uniref:Uncharacterized protein n=1 Tax=Methanobacterium paludis (strain DSM 25820 / JCM 18151 / SWAN1) TaxID=868131 RepID=F6D2S3_METPW|nr:hypothetical protein [Methanobacterium paludis]AEG18652.1 hypothetical protein MSWAN_1641 [Methanobacterium paludis]